MTRSLPPELIDLIIDHLCDQRATLKACCLVSRSWVPRARRHLFSHVEFDSDGWSSDIEPWMEAFPDPLNSPAHHTRSLTISGLAAVTAATMHGHSWVRSFRYIVELVVDTRWWDDDKVSLVQLHGLSPTLKSLRVVRSSLPLPEVFNLTCSFPLLEDLSLISSRLRYQHVRDPVDSPSTSQKLTGSLLLKGDIRLTTRWLLNFPRGLHFSKISIHCPGPWLESAVNLVSRCSDTLESLCVVMSPSRGTPPFDLSKVANLKYVEFRWKQLEIQWITTSLQTAQSPNLRQITITLESLSVSIGSVGEAIHREWRDLDRLLVQLWTSRSILPKIGYRRQICGDDLRDLTPSLLPELTSRGAVSVLGYRFSQSGE